MFKRCLLATVVIGAVVAACGTPSTTLADWDDDDHWEDDWDDDDRRWGHRHRHHGHWHGHHGHHGHHRHHWRRPVAVYPPVVIGGYYPATYYVGEPIWYGYYSQPYYGYYGSGIRVSVGW